MATEELSVVRQLPRPIWRRALTQLFALYIAANMALCAVLFFPWALPRETISGLLGRWQCTDTGWKPIVALVLVPIVNRIYFWEPDHCRQTYMIEKRAREILYP